MSPSDVSLPDHTVLTQTSDINYRCSSYQFSSFFLLLSQSLEAPLQPGAPVDTSVPPRDTNIYDERESGVEARCAGETVWWILQQAVTLQENSDPPCGAVLFTLITRSCSLDLWPRKCCGGELIVRCPV